MARTLSTGFVPGVGKAAIVLMRTVAFVVATMTLYFFDDVKGPLSLGDSTLCVLDLSSRYLILNSILLIVYFAFLHAPLVGTNGEELMRIFTIALLVAYYVLEDARVAATVLPPKPFHTAKIFVDPFPSIAVRIGNSNDTIKVEVDMGSSEFWINPAMLVHPSTTTQMSSQQFNNTYEIGFAAGHVAADEIHIGMLNQLDLTPNRRFGLADVQVSDDMAHQGGIIGFSRYDPTKLVYPGGWDMLAPALVPRVIGLRMQHPLPGTSVADADAVGQIDYGAPDPKYVAQGITYTSINESKTMDGWYIHVHGSHVNGKPTGLGPRSAFLDTGSTGIMMTDADAATVNALLGGKAVPAQDSGKSTQYVLPCNSGPAVLQIDIEGRLFAVPNYLLLGSAVQGDASFCSSWIQGGGNDWTLGSGFLQAVYTVWDYDGKRVGFAKVPALQTSDSPAKGSPGAASEATELHA